MVRRVNNAGSIQWTKTLGPSSAGSASVGYSVSEVPKTIHTPKIQNHLIFFLFSLRLAFQADGKLFLGVGLWQSNVQKAAVVALDVSNGNTLWTTFMPGSTRCVNHHDDFLKTFLSAINGLFTAPTSTVVCGV